MFVNSSLALRVSPAYISIFVDNICDLTYCISDPIEYGIFGEGFQISTNQKRGNSAFSFLIGCKLGPFRKNTVLYKHFIVKLFTLFFITETTEQVAGEAARNSYKLHQMY